MKIRLELIRLTKKDMADAMTLTGVAAILSIVFFATSNDIPIGEMAPVKNYGWDA